MMVYLFSNLFSNENQLALYHVRTKAHITYNYGKILYSRILTKILSSFFSNFKSKVFGASEWTITIRKKEIENRKEWKGGDDKDAENLERFGWKWKQSMTEERGYKGVKWNGWGIRRRGDKWVRNEKERPMYANKGWECKKCGVVRNIGHKALQENGGIVTIIISMYFLLFLCSILFYVSTN